MTIHTETWRRDSHGLFDYESTETLKLKLKSSSDCSVFRKNDEISLTPSPTPSPSSLAQVSFTGASCEIHSTTDPLWRLVRSNRGLPESNGYVLREGDILKFGRVKYIVRELRSTPGPENTCSRAVEVDTTGNSCKICLSDQQDPGNPLVSPCKCSGTMKYIHVQCLQMCVQSQMNVKATDYCKSYAWKSLHCSLCGELFPYSISALGVEHSVLTIERPELPYFVIEGVSEHGSNRGMHSTSLKNCESVVLGRGHDSHIRIGDISVSRCHARIKFCNGRFVLEDNNSKFGTLVQVNCAEVALGEIIAIQSGRSLLQFKLKEKRID